MTTFLDHATNFVGSPLSERSRTLIGRFLLDPSESNWDAIYSIVVARSMRRGTIWQAVLAIDPTFPTSKPDPHWTRIPDAMLVARAIKEATQAMKETAR